tara:strand:- start:350 stop:772 length:423 start_codon:yes stop_codon:yes gene_type:complete
MKSNPLRAGSLVVNNNNEILLIFRKGMWDLPKGKLEIEEPPSQGALRETSEETGLKLKKLKVKSKLTTTSHLLNGEDVKTKWFLVKYKGFKYKLIPQKKEGIKECKWVSEDLLVYYMPELRNYARDVFDFYFSTVKTHQL